MADPQLVNPEQISRSALADEVNSWDKVRKRFDQLFLNLQKTTREAGIKGEITEENFPQIRFYKLGQTSCEENLKLLGKGPLNSRELAALKEKRHLLEKTASEFEGYQRHAKERSTFSLEKLLEDLSLGPSLIGEAAELTLALKKAFNSFSSNASPHSILEQVGMLSMVVLPGSSKSRSEFVKQLGKFKGQLEDLSVSASTGLGAQAKYLAGRTEELLEKLTPGTGVFVPEHITAIKNYFAEVSDQLSVFRLDIPKVAKERYQDLTKGLNDLRGMIPSDKRVLAKAMFNERLTGLQKVEFANSRS